MRYRLLLVFAVALGCLPVRAQAQARITGRVDDSTRVVLSGNTHPRTRTGTDLGRVDDGAPMRRMVLTLSRSDAQEAALTALMVAQQDKGSASFHQWLTPVEYGARFGVADADLSTITGWLTAQGFTIGKVGNGRNTIEFSGTVGQVRTAFATEIHRYAVEGAVYQGNASDPSIPAALAAVVKGIVSLHNFPAHPHSSFAGSFQRDPATGELGRKLTPDATEYTYGGSRYVVTPYDFATIYNVLPLWNAGIDGTGQSIAVLQESNIHLDDVRAFRSLFGLPANDPVVILNGADPGVTEYDEGEADIDVEWSGAVAKGATIKLVVSATTETTAGTSLSALYAVDNNIAPITTLSYGECELGLGTSGNAFWNTLWQQGAAEGITHFVSSGDSGAAGCDGGSTSPATFGLAVSGLASTPYDTAVGGTDFLGTILTPGTFWSQSNNGTTQASALGYMPEGTWNNNCTNPLYQTAFYGNAYASAEAACQALSAYSSADTLAPLGGSGGASGCTTVTGSAIPAHCSGGYAKPAWQAGTGVPADGKRDLPDVALLAANGSLPNVSGGGVSYQGSFYFVCQEDAGGGGSCSTGNFEGYGGTSVAGPAFAGIMALVDQKTNARQGVANYVLYDLFNQQVAAGTSCTSSYTNIVNGSGTPVLPAASCIFNDVTFGGNSSPCVTGDTNCTTANGYTYGILTTSSSTVPASTEAYLNGVGYDEAAGLGSVNANNLVNGWANITFVPTTTTLGLTPVSIAHGTSVTASVTVASTTTGTPTGNVEFMTSTVPSSEGFVALSSGSASSTLSALPGGSYTVSAFYAGDATFAPSASTPVAMTVTAESSTLTGNVYRINPTTGASAAATSATYGATIYVSMRPKGTSGKGVPSGTVTFSDEGTAVGTVTLSASGEALYESTTLAVGGHSFTASYSGDASFNASNTTAAKALTITQVSSTASVATSTGSTTQGTPVTLTATITGASASTVGNLGVAPTGSVTFYSGSTSLGTVQTLASGNSAVYNYTTLNGVATLTTANLPVGSDSITAVYAGDTNYASVTSGASTVTIAASSETASTTQVSATSTSFAYGGSTSVTATVTGTGGTPTGTVTFYVDGSQNGSAGLAGGSASLTLSTLPGGAHTVVAAYGGDGTFQGSSGAIAVTVSPASTGVTLSSSASSAAQGVSLLFTAAVPYSLSARPTGTLSFSVDGSATGAGIAIEPFNTGGVGAYFNSSTLAPGSHTVKVTYAGDKDYAGSSASVPVTITAAPALTLTLSQASTIVLGAPVKVTVQAKTLSSGPVPTGNYTYAVDGGTASSASLNNGLGSFTLSRLSELRHTVVVMYGGDSTYTPVAQTLTLNGDVAQTILFPGIAAYPSNSSTGAVALVAHATSGLPVTFTVSGPATISGTTLTVTGAGTVTVVASQAGNASFAAAANVSWSFVAQ